MISVLWHAQLQKLSSSPILTVARLGASSFDLARWGSGVCPFGGQSMTECCNTLDVPSSGTPEHFTVQICSGRGCEALHNIVAKVHPVIVEEPQNYLSPAHST